MVKLLRVIEKASDKIVEEIDVRGESARAVAQIKDGLQAQLNHEEYRVEDVE